MVTEDVSESDHHHVQGSGDLDKKNGDGRSGEKPDHGLHPSPAPAIQVLEDSDYFLGF